MTFRQLAERVEGKGLMDAEVGELHVTFTGATPDDRYREVLAIDVFVNQRGTLTIANSVCY